MTSVSNVVVYAFSILIRYFSLISVAMGCFPWYMRNLLPEKSKKQCTGKRAIFALFLQIEGSDLTRLRGETSY